MPLDVSKDEDIAAIAAKAKDELGTLDFVLHSIAFASLDDLKRETIATSREGFKLAMDISVYSLLAVSNAVRPILSNNSSILTLTYFGGERILPGYNVMGICKGARHVDEVLCVRPRSRRACVLMHSAAAAQDAGLVGRWGQGDDANSTPRSRRWAAT